MTLYLVESGYGDNYIMAETEDGLLCSECSPTGEWAGIYIGSYEHGVHVDMDELSKRLHEATRHDLSEADLDFMGSPCYSSMDEWEAEQDGLESFKRDHLYLIGNFGFDKEVYHDGTVL